MDSQIEAIRRQTTEELRRRLSFHDNDRGTMTFEEECRRLWFVQEIGDELKRRGDNPFN